MVRRIAISATGVVLALSAAALCGSVAHLSWGQLGNGAGFWLCGGDLMVQNDRPRVALGDPADWEDHGVPWPYWSESRRRNFVGVFSEPGSKMWLLRMPLWPLVFASAIVLAVAWLAGQISRSNARHAGRCRFCAYDLTGSTGPCPECGQERRT